MIRSRSLIIASFSVLGLVSASLAQAPGSDHGTMLFRSNVGSFKMAGSDDRPAEGRVEFTFTGTVLVIGEPKVEVSGNVRSEYRNQEYKRQVYNGTGKIVIEGKFDAIQFFGRNVSGSWKGWGLVRFFGEFDKNLNTGDYWYPEKPNDKFPWGNYGSTAHNPKQLDAMQQVQPKPVVVPPKKKG
jgi:hypothetical protein